MRALGIDPGTSSFDVICLENNDKIILEELIPTNVVAKQPEVLFEVVSRIEPDVMVGPSAMGVPCKHISKMSDIDIAYATLAKNTEVDIAIRKFIAMLKAHEYNVFFVPSVIQLPTVPSYRKTNKVDMGTADKTCIAALAIWDFTQQYNVHYRDARLIVVELGFGFNAVIAIEGGQIIDGIGGTSFPGPGFLTIGALDLELSHLLGRFSERQLGIGGAAYIAANGEVIPEDFTEKIDTDKRFQLAWESLVEGVIKAVAMESTTLKAKEILISGRLSRIKNLYERLRGHLETTFDQRIRRVKGLSETTKEAAQGAALIANGLENGVYKELIDVMMLREANGTVLDNVYWPFFDVKTLMANKIELMKK